MEGLFVLICIYNYTFGLLFSFILGENDSLVLRGLAVAILIYSIGKYQGSLKWPADAVNVKKYNKWLMLVLLILIGMLFTSFINGGINSVAKTCILSYGTRVVSAVFLSFVFVRKGMIISINKWINIFADFYTLVLFAVVLMNTGGKLADFEVNRQSLSYAGAFALVMHAYINSNYSSVGYFWFFRSFINKIINYLLIAIDIFIVVAGGGRGAFILAVFAGLYFVIKNIHSLGIRGVIGVIVFVVVVSSILVYASSSMFSISGYNSIRSSFEGGFTDMSSMQRRELYETAWKTARESFFIGNGAVSFAYTVGFYTHNIFTDVLVDYGIIGIIVIIIIIISFFANTFSLMKISENSMPEFLLLVFLSSFVMLLFSGSFYCDGGLWFSLVSMSITNKSLYTRIDNMELQTN